MHSALSLLALAAAVQAYPQAVTANIPPPSPAPQGCSPDYSGTFQITVVNVTTSAAKVKRQSQPLECTLSGGVLKDSQQRTGYIASNYQFQFDGPPQVNFFPMLNRQLQMTYKQLLGGCNLHFRFHGLR
jgi:hypothetical protein